MANESWQKIASLRVSLLPHVRVVPQAYRGTRWYLLKNEATGDFTRLNASAHAFVSRLHTETTVEHALESHNNSCAEEEQASQAAIVNLISMLLSSNLLSAQTQEEPAAKSARFKALRDHKLISKLSNPLTVSVPLFNPDRVITRAMPYFRWIFTYPALVVWFCLVAVGAMIALAEFDAMAYQLSGELITARSVITTVLIYIVLKTLHELSHALAIKHFGGDVKACGITFLVFSPIPYVDASSAWAFQDKHHRMLVSAMGVITELAVGSVALLVWSFSAPGPLQTLALDVALVAIVSTLVFNANPLLKFDGYFVLQDQLEMPNLYSRAKLYLVYLLKRYIVGLDTAHSPVYEHGETVALFVYGTLSFLYRLVLLCVITAFLVNELLVVGVLVAMWVVFTQVLKPVYRSAVYLARNPDLDSIRTKSLCRLAVSCAVVGVVVFLVPFPNTTTAKGTVWVDDQAAIYSAHDGTLAEVFERPGSRVAKGRPLFTMNSPEIEADIARLEARHEELKIVSQAGFVDGTERSWKNNEQLAGVEYELNQLYLDREALKSKAAVDGVFFSPDILHRKTQHYRRGEFVGYVFAPENVIVRAVFPQSDIGRIRNGIDEVQVRLAERPRQVLDAEFIRETPAGTVELPSQALAATGGGDIAVLNQPDGQDVATEEHFTVDFAIENRQEAVRVGGVVYIRIAHAAAPLFDQISSRLRQVFFSTIQI